MRSGKAFCAFLTAAAMLVSSCAQPIELPSAPPVSSIEGVYVNGEQVSGAGTAYTGGGENEQVFGAMIPLPNGNMLIAVACIGTDDCAPGKSFSADELSGSDYLDVEVYSMGGSASYSTSATPDFFSDPQVFIGAYSLEKFVEFYIKTEITHNGESYLIEMNTSAPYAANGQQAQTGGTCLYCGGDKKCPLCGGVGYWNTSGTKADCSSCGGGGKCYYCEGTGKQVYNSRGTKKV